MTVELISLFTFGLVFMFSVQCSGCPLTVEVPESLFSWNCINGHTNKGEIKECSECKTVRPAPSPDQQQPTVTCPTCHTVTIVPATNASKHVKEAATNTKKFAVAAAAGKQRR